MFQTKAKAGETPVIVVRFDKKKRRCNDSINYTHESICAVIPCWKSGNTYISMKTGNPVDVTCDDDVRTLTRGIAPCYADGTQMIYGLNYRTMECEFIERTKNQGVTLNCFGE